jgi:heme exporter protein CcmB
MPISVSIRCLWWLIHKDLVHEFRSQQAWPRALLLGLVLVLLVAAQVDLPVDQRAGAVSGLLWITIFVSATVSIERSFASELEDGCWQALQRYPVSPSVIFLAKTIVNAMTTLMLACVLIPLFVVLTDVPLLARFNLLAATVVLGSLGLAAVGTLVSAVIASVRDGGGLLVLLLLPLATPILLSAAEATRIALSTNADPLWSWWIQLLAAFAFVFTVIGVIVFEFAMEE